MGCVHRCGAGGETRVGPRQEAGRDELVSWSDYNIRRRIGERVAWVVVVEIGQRQAWLWASVDRDYDVVLIFCNCGWWR